MLASPLRSLRCTPQPSRIIRVFSIVCACTKFSVTVRRCRSKSPEQVFVGAAAA